MVKRWALLAFVVVLVGLYVVFTQPREVTESFAPLFGSGPLTELQQFGDQNKDNFIKYQDPYYRFSLFYPKGYLAEQNAQPGVYLQFTAATFDDVEVISVVPLEGESYGDAEFEQDAPEGVTLQERRRLTLEGRTVYVLDSTSQPLAGSNYTVFIKQAVVPNCQSANGTRYSLFFTAAVPERLQADLLATEYMVHSLRCTGVEN